MRVELLRDGIKVASIVLDDGGRGGLLGQVEVGPYELLFHAGDYQGSEFFDIIPIRFYAHDAGEKYHIPLILSTFGYSTYRGG
jgi:5-hydroxyisourate hydrolase